MPGTHDIEFEAIFKSMAGSEVLRTLAIASTILSDRFEVQSAATPAPTLPRLSLAWADAELADNDNIPDGEHDIALEKMLGAGGMGAVYLAWQRSVGRHVAVKLLNPGPKGTSASARLVREARIMGMLEHPSIIPVHAVGMVDEKQAAIVMKRVEGATWSECLLDREHPLIRDVQSDRDLLAFHIGVLRKVCDAVSLAHERGVVHRDLKPDNVMLGPHGEVYLVDWGVAAEVGSRAPNGFVGTPAFAAPEMIEQGVIDARTDVYQLGAVLHFVITGSHRHHGDNLYDVLLSAFASYPSPYEAGIPGELAALCNRATSRIPSDRPPSAEAFRQQLVDFERHQVSRHLADASDEKLVALDELLSSSPERTSLPVDRADSARQLGTEARFGYQQALLQWAEHQEALEGSQRCIVLMADLELRQGNLDAAKSIASGLRRPDADLHKRIQDLESERIKARQEQAALRRFALEHDPDVAPGPRRTFAFLVFIGCTALSIYASAAATVDSITQSSLVWVGAGVLTIVLAVVAAFHRRLLQTAFMRATVGSFTALCVMVLASRVLGLVEDASVSSILVRDLLICAGCAAVGGFHSFRWLFAAAAIAFTGALVTSAMPAHATLTFSVVVTICLAVPMFLWWRNPAGGLRGKVAEGAGSDN